MEEIYIKTKALSVNQCWQGRRFKTGTYKEYERSLLHSLPSIVIPVNTKLEIDFEIGYSSTASDLDNSVKPLLDILQKKYLFNDKWVYAIHLYKEIVKKGEEYVRINILPWN